MGKRQSRLLSQQRGSNLSPHINVLHNPHIVSEKKTMIWTMNKLNKNENDDEAVGEFKILQTGITKNLVSLIISSDPFTHIAKTAAATTTTPFTTRLEIGGEQ